MWRENWERQLVINEKQRSKIYFIDKSSCN